jgi:hypothetical protein
MSAKTHIVDSVEPLPFFERTDIAREMRSVIARCGLPLVNPETVFMWDEQEMGEPLNLPLGICRKCLKAEDPRLRYTYGVKV